VGLLNGTKRVVDHVMLDIEGIANKGSLSLVGAVIINTVSSTYCKRMILFPKSVQIANKEAARKIGPLTKQKIVVPRSTPSFSMYIISVP
jgi:hypothetical protein